MLKVCPKCLRTIPATRFKAHQRVHRKSYRLPSGRAGSTRSYRRARAIAMERDGWRCVRCGKAPPAVSLETHHIDGDWTNDAVSNLATVCQDHNPRGGNVGRT